MSFTWKEKYSVNVLSDCITSYDKRKIDEMLRYYESKGSKITCLNDLLSHHTIEAPYRTSEGGLCDG